MQEPGNRPGKTGIDKERPEPFCTELCNEGWLLRLILECFRSRPEVEALLNLVERLESGIAS